MLDLSIVRRGGFSLVLKIVAEPMTCVWLFQSVILESILTFFRTVWPSKTALTCVKSHEEHVSFTRSIFLEPPAGALDRLESDWTPDLNSLKATSNVRWKARSIATINPGVPDPGPPRNNHWLMPGSPALESPPASSRSRFPPPP